MKKLIDKIKCFFGMHYFIGDWDRTYGEAGHCRRCKKDMFRYWRDL